MKKTVLTFGLISGGILGLMMLGTMPFIDRIGYDKGMVVGYTTMVVSFLLIFFGIRSYRENVNGGTISFGRGLVIGILITLLATVVYVITWEIIYFGIPGFAEKFIAMCVEHIKSSNVAAEEIQKQLDMIKWLDNPFINAALTFTEPLPVGIIMTLISAAVLRKKPQAEAADNQPLAA